MNYDIVTARSLRQTHPDLYNQILESVTPMLSNLGHISSILSHIQVMFPDCDNTDKMLIFTSVVYDCYCPASYLPKAGMKLPIGIRDEAARVAGFINPEMLNYYHQISKSYMKTTTAHNGVSPFRSKVNSVKEMFKQFSANPKHWELNLV